MCLTEDRRTPRDLDKFPTAQLLLLALVRLAEPIALTSIFPYAWKLVCHFHVGEEQDAAFYAGLLISAFSLAEACSGMYWGSFSDRVGRKPVLLFGCFGTLLSLLIVGFAPNFWIALLGRILGGMLNGNIGVIQTMVGELVEKPEHEPLAFAVMPFVWSVGTIIGPCIGGYFAEPVESFPSVFLPSSIFAVFPYLLPNLVCSLILLGAITAGYFFLMETHLNMQAWDTEDRLDSATAGGALLPTAGATAHAVADLRSESYGTFDLMMMEENDTLSLTPARHSASFSSPPDEKVFTKQVIMLIAALGIFTYHNMTYDHILPIFLQDRRASEMATHFISNHHLAGGLGLSIQDVGLIMTVNGLMALFIQAIIFPALASWLGVWRLLALATIGHPMAYFIVPYITVLPQNALYLGIYICLAIRNLFSIVDYPLLLILIKEASTSPSHLGKINGAAASTSAACRMIASPIAGLLYGVGAQLGFNAVPWWASSIVAIAGICQLPLSRRSKTKTTTVRTPTPSTFMPPEECPKGDIIMPAMEVVPQLCETPV